MIVVASMNSTPLAMNAGPIDIASAERFTVGLL
jgi:hypothetical protein